MKKTILALTVGTSLLASAQSGFAKLASTAATYSITLESDCTVSVSGTTFPTKPAGRLANETMSGGAIDVTCTSGVNYEVGMSAGQNYYAYDEVRRMKSPAGNTLGYIIKFGLGYKLGDSYLYTIDPSYVATCSGSSIGGVGTGAVQTYPLTAELLFKDLVWPAGTYTDTVNVVVAFP